MNLKEKKIILHHFSILNRLSKITKHKYNNYPKYTLIILKNINKFSSHINIEKLLGRFRWIKSFEMIILLRKTIIFLIISDNHQSQMHHFFLKFIFNIIKKKKINLK
jgi:hypothetical protein